MCIYVFEDDPATHLSGPRDAFARTAAVAAVLGPAFAALLGLQASAAVVPALRGLASAAAHLLLLCAW